MERVWDRLDPMTGLYVRNFALILFTQHIQTQTKGTRESAERRHKRDAWLRSVAFSPRMSRALPLL
ncbi:MAG: hypothetical protein GY941_16920 [Planctomycetes bacterium]|nr:hypothetical protein [Planctomycetota bacterium]